MNPHPVARGLFALGSGPNCLFARSPREYVRRSYREQPWRYSGDVAGITGEETRAAPECSGDEQGEEGKK